MFQYMNDIKSASRRQCSEKQKIVPMGKETCYTGVPQYIGRNQNPIQRELDDGDIQAIMNSEIDQRLKTEFQRIYEGNKNNITYDALRKGVMRQLSLSNLKLYEAAKKRKYKIN